MIGILGGTFDPVHNGHLRIALDVFQQCQCDRVHLMPSFRPPHREQPMASPENRLAMLKLAVGDEFGLLVDDLEYRYDQISYSIESLRRARARYPDSSIAMIMGFDVFSKIDLWKDWQRLLDVAHLIVTKRPYCNDDLGDVVARYRDEHRVDSIRPLHDNKAGYIYQCELTQLDISSSTIRKMIENSKSVNYLVPQNVNQYLLDNNLYQSECKE